MSFISNISYKVYLIVQGYCVCVYACVCVCVCVCVCPGHCPHSSTSECFFFVFILVGSRMCHIVSTSGSQQVRNSESIHVHVHAHVYHMCVYPSTCDYSMVCVQTLFILQRAATSKFLWADHQHGN